MQNRNKKQQSFIIFFTAGAVIRMMSHILGLENFQKGLREYLNKMYVY